MKEKKNSTITGLKIKVANLETEKTHLNNDITNLNERLNE